MYQVEGKFKENLKFQNALPLQLKNAEGKISNISLPTENPTSLQDFISIRDGHENFVPTTRLMFTYTEWLTEYINLKFQ
jgi:hypothetical protein